MNTLINIDAEGILASLATAKPLSMSGIAAVESLRSWLANNALTASAIQVACESLGKLQDPGLASAIAAFESLQSKEHMQVALAYESLAATNAKAGIFAVGNEAFEGLEALYRLNAAKIVESINSGALDKFKTSPVIAKLINWAKSTYNLPLPEKHVNADNGEYSAKMSLVPVLTLGYANDIAIQYIDGLMYSQAKNGALTPITASVLSDANSSIVASYGLLKQFVQSETEPSIMTLHASLANGLSVVLGINEIAVDLANGDIIINGNTRVDQYKFNTLVKDKTNDVVAAIVAGASTLDIMKSTVDAINRLAQMSFGSITYAFKAKFGRNHVITLSGARINLIHFVDDVLMSCRSYTSVFAMLGSDTIIAQPAMHNALSIAYGDDLTRDMKKAEVRQQIAERLAGERMQYENLLVRIDTQMSELEAELDPSEDKIAKLQALKAKVQSSLDVTIGEIGKLSKKQ